MTPTSERSENPCKFSCFSFKTYVLGTQKNRLNETVLLSTQNKYLYGLVRKYSQVYAHFLGGLSGPMYFWINVWQQEAEDLNENTSLY